MGKQKAKTIVAVLILAFAIILSSLPIASSHTPPWIRPVYAYISVSPPVTGLNQQVLIVFWLDMLPPTSQGAYGDRWTFYVDMTKPDGTKETLGPFKSDPVGSCYTPYTPTQLGKYTVVCRFPQTTLTGMPTFDGKPSTNVNVNDTMLAATSAPETFTVQQEKIPTYVETPLPDSYWTRPIYGANRYWYDVAGNWLGGAHENGNSVAWYAGGPTSSFAYGEGPESAHVLWTRSYWSGGVMGTDTGSIAYYGGISYEGYGAPIMIMEGKLWYAQLTPPRYGYYCVDLYTGETIYWRNTTGTISRGGGFDASGTVSNGVPAFGQIYDPELPNQHGGMPYFWVTSTGTSNKWDLYDAFSGNYICSVANVSSSGTNVYGRDGSILYYNIVNLGTTNAPNYYLQLWNTTEAIWWRPQYGAYEPKTLLNGSHSVATSTSNTYWMWRPYLDYTFDGRNGFSMNVSIASILGPRNSIANQTGSILSVREGQYLIVGTAGRNDARGTVQGYMRALSLKPGQWGTKLWEITFTPPKATPEYPNSTYLGENSAPTLGTVDPETGVFFYEERVTLRRWGYSLETGQQLWGPSAPEGQFSYYGMSDFIYQGKLISFGYSGIMLAYDAKTGKILWNWTAPSEGAGETWYKYSPLSLGVIADGKAYMYSSEHSPSSPLRRDNNIWCVDLNTGKLVWKMSSWPAGPKIADGRLVLLNHFDEQIYCYGKGPSATTVEVQNDVITRGQTVLVKGTITDQSPSGRHNVAGSIDFSLKDTPAISDADMEDWMEYLFQQRPKPTNAKGVEVKLYTIDPNGNNVPIGTTTSDITGQYTILWTPEVTGKYKVVAEFAGSKSYGPSTGQAYIGVVAGPTASIQPPPEPTPTQPSPSTPAPSTATTTPTPTSVIIPPTSAQPTTTYLAIGAAIIIVIAVAAALILRKRK